MIFFVTERSIPAANNREYSKALLRIKTVFERKPGKQWKSYYSVRHFFVVIPLALKRKARHRTTLEFKLCSNIPALRTADLVQRLKRFVGNLENRSTSNWNLSFAIIRRTYGLYGTKTVSKILILCSKLKMDKIKGFLRTLEQVDSENIRCSWLLQAPDQHSKCQWEVDISFKRLGLILVSKTHLKKSWIFSENSNISRPFQL